MITQNNKNVVARHLNILLVFTALSVFLTGCEGNEIDKELNAEYKAYALESACNYVNQEKYTIENEIQYVNEYICDCIDGCEIIMSAIQSSVMSMIIIKRSR